MERKDFLDKLSIAAHQNIKEKRYWLEKLSGDLVKSCFIRDASAAAPGERTMDRSPFHIDEELFSRMLTLSNRSDYTLHLVLVAGLVTLLFKYTGDEDIIVGSPIYQPETEGEFINTVLPLRHRLKKNTTFREMLGEVKRTVVEATDNQNYPFEILIDQLSVPVSENGDFPLFDVAILLENIHDRKYLHHINLNMIFSFLRKNNRLEGSLIYNSLLYRPETAERITDNFRNLLRTALFNLETEVSRLEILSEQDRNRLLYDFNRTAAGYPADRTIHGLFEEQVEKRPGKTALLEGSSESGGWQKRHFWSYDELNMQANRLARTLRASGVGRNDIVGLLLERSGTMVSAILASLKAGACYLPIDTDTPLNRIATMLGDCRPAALLTETGAVNRFPFCSLQRPQLAHIKPRLTAVRPQINDFDGLPIPDRSLVDYEKYNRHIGIALVKNNISIQATRGCPYNCAYCHKIWPKRHVARSAENIFSEVKLYAEMGVKHFTFVDDIFNLDVRNSTKFFQLAARSGLDIHFHFPAGLRGDILSRDFIDLMVEAGTLSLALALETASPRLQKLIGKNLKIDRLHENMEYICRTYPQVISELFTMYGFPTETEEEALKTLEFTRSLRWLHFPYFHILKIYPNTDMEALAVKNGISPRAIIDSENLAYHELPETLPFDRSFLLKIQAEFFNEYFMSRERLLQVLPHQMKVLTESELAQKYDSYLPVEVRSLDDLLRFTDISLRDLDGATCLDEATAWIPDLNCKIKQHFSPAAPSVEGMRIFLLDLSQFFSNESHMLYDVIEPPLGLMNLITYLNRQYGDRVAGKVAKSRIDFDSYDELKLLMNEFKPDLIGIRSLTYYKHFFHKTAAMIRHWGIGVPIIAGGPYATSDYASILRDPNVDLVVMGEGELTFGELVGKMIENGGRFPDESTLEHTYGIAYVPGKIASRQRSSQPVLMVDTLYDVLTEQSPLNVETAHQPGDPAYIIYTSGTTGRPKGVMIEHRNVVRLLFNDRSLFDFNHGDRWSLFHAYNFDFSVWEMYGALLYGGELVVIPDMVTRDPEAFLRILEEEKITILNQTPTAFYNLIQELLFQGERRLKIRYLIFGGEALMPMKLKKWQRMFPSTRLINMFGITETTVHVTYKEIGETEIRMNISNIGRPIPTLSTYIMDEYSNLLPIGIPGELCVGGDGVGRGYLNRQELTESKFMENPFKPGERLYRSGDLAKLLDNGEMVYLGRIDHQVKIRGYRIELGEIESRLLKYPTVSEVLVATGEDKMENRYLCAYVVPTAGADLNVSVIREYLLTELPDYMVPTHIVRMETFPLTPNGKIDRRALPDPVLEVGNFSGELDAPETGIEAVLADIWAQVLGREKVGRDENFFAVGGDSIKSIQIASRMKRSGYRLEIKDLFQYPTIAQLAPLVKKSERIPDQSPVTGELPLTPIQEAFFRHHLRDPHHFNQSVMLDCKEETDEATVTAVFSRLQEHHDALRTTFTVRNGAIRQAVKGTDHPLSLEVCDLRDNKDPAAAMSRIGDRIQAGIDLESGPLMRLALFQLADRCRLLIVIHHLVVDGISWRILFEDIETLYRCYHRGEPLALPSKTDSFRLWSERLTAYAGYSPSLLTEELAYWGEQETIETVAIPTDFEAAGSVEGDVRSRSFSLSADETGRLLTEVNRAFGSEINDVLLTALGLALKGMTGCDRLLVTLEGHGREELFEDVDVGRTVGWFTTMYPLSLDFSFSNDMARQLKEVKERLRRVPRRGIGYGILRYSTPPELRRGVEFRLQPQISFNYLGQFDAEVEGMKSFGVSRESGGRERSLNQVREHDLEVTGLVAGGCLRMSIRFSSRQYREETMAKWWSGYRDELVRLIDFCSARQEREWTPSDFTYRELTLEQLEELLRRAGGGVEDIYPLSPMQEGMLFHALYDSASGAYFEQLSYRLGGDVDAAVVRRSLVLLMQRYDILRTVFFHEGLDRPLQLVLAEREADFHFRESLPASVEDREAYVSRYRESDRTRGFDLNRDVLLRVSILRLGEWEYEFIWSHHHILMDGWCMGIIISEFLEIYRGLLEERQPRLPAVVPYRNYISWLEGRDRERSRLYWNRYLKGYQESAGVPRLKGYKTDLADYLNEQALFTLPRQTTEALYLIAGDNQVTMNILIQTVWGIILSRYAGKEDVVFGTVVSGRPAEIIGIESMVGLFLNTIPVRIRFERDTRFDDLIHRVQKEAIESEPHHYFPLSEIQAESVLNQNLLNHIFVFENYPVEDRIVEAADVSRNKRESALKLFNLEVFEQTNYDFNIIIGPRNELNIKFGFNANVYDRELVDRVAGHMREVVQQILTRPNIVVMDFMLLSEEEKNQILYEFNATSRPYPYTKPIHILFESQAAKMVDTTAVMFQDQHLTYTELNDRANRLARYIYQRGTQPDSVVGLMLERSIEMEVGIFGILKAGCAYLPMDPFCPRERLQFMIKDGHIRTLLTCPEYVHHFEFEGELVNLHSREVYFESIDNVHTPVQPYALVYVIYTSGSTGKPKGVMIEHRSLINRLNWKQRAYPLGREATLMQKTPYTFDVSAWELFWWIFPGARVYFLTPGAEKDPRAIIDAVERQRISIIHFVPSMLNAFLEYIRESEEAYRLRSLKWIIASGEALMPHQAAAFNDLLYRNHRCRLANLYGPTEATIDVSGYNCPPDADIDKIPIGKPIDNIKLLVVDRANRLQPVATAGELCIAGVGLARGYLNRPEMTAASFVDNPFGADEKMYLTGDLARWLPDGNIEFIGRSDHQVKIRGFRIELGEIESCLLAHQEIKEAVVTVQTGEDDDASLCAYFVSRREIETQELREFLGRRLPEYMIPDYFIHNDNIALTPSGKIDRNELLKKSVSLRRPMVAPRDETELSLREIWAEVLGIDREVVGIDTSFFELGGHSLKATILATRIHRAFNIRIPLAAIFKALTIRGLAQYLRRADEERFTSVRVVEKKAYYPASSAQKRLFALQQVDPDSTSYNISEIFVLGGKLDRLLLEETFHRMIRRHESLRTFFALIGGQPVQRVEDKVKFSMPCHESPGNETADIVGEFVQPFDLGLAPLLRVGLIKTGRDNYVMMLDMHHIIADGTSMRIFIREFLALHAGTSLPPLRIQYKDYSVWQYDEMESELMRIQEAYWLDQFEDGIPVLNLPTDFSRPPVKGFAGSSISFSLNKEERTLLNSLALEENVTLYMVLLAAFNVLLSRLSGQEDIVVGTPLAGRRHADLDNVIGTFINMLAIRSLIGGEQSFRQFLNETRERTLSAFENQDYQFENLVIKLVKSRDTGRNPLFDVILEHQNFDARPEGTDAVRNPGLNLAKYDYQDRTAKYDLSLISAEAGDTLACVLEYDTKLFKRETVERIIGDFSHILLLIGDNPDIKIREIELASVSVHVPGETLNVEFNI